MRGSEVLLRPERGQKSEPEPPEPDGWIRFLESHREGETSDGFQVPPGGGDEEGFRLPPREAAHQDRMDHA